MDISNIIKNVKQPDIDQAEKQLSSMQKLCPDGKYKMIAFEKE